MPAVTTSYPRFDLEFFLAVLRVGDGEGIGRFLGKGAVTAQATPSLQVDVDTFVAVVAQTLHRGATKVALPAITPPTGGTAPALRRIDLVQFTKDVGLNIKTGVEGAGPSAPVKDADSLKFAELHLRKGMTVIKDADDGTNGFIVDAREFF